LIYLPAGIPAGVANFAPSKPGSFNSFAASSTSPSLGTEEDRRGVSGIFRDRESRKESRNDRRPSGPAWKNSDVQFAEPPPWLTPERKKKFERGLGRVSLASAARAHQDAEKAAARPKAAELVFQDELCAKTARRRNRTTKRGHHQPRRRQYGIVVIMVTPTELLLHLNRRRPHRIRQRHWPIWSLTLIVVTDDGSDFQVGNATQLLLLQQAQGMRN
jgi:hypothetical protein